MAVLTVSDLPALPLMCRMTRPVAWWLWAVLVAGLVSLAHGQEQGKEPKGPPGERRESREGSRRAVSAEDVGAMLDVLREIEPELAADIDKWRAEDPQRVALMIGRRFPRLRHMVDLQRNDPAQYALRIEDLRLSRQTLELVRQYRAAALAKDAKAAELRSQLRDNLARHFEVRQQIRQRELEKFEQRIEQMRKELEERAAARDKILEHELGKLTDERNLDKPAED